MAGNRVARLPVLGTISWDACRLLVDNVTDYAIFLLDVHGNVASWNRGAQRINGYAADEIVGRSFAVFYTPEDVAAAKPEVELRLATTVGRFEEEGWRVGKDGRRFWAHVVITALRDDDGTLRGFGKITRDISARRREEDALRQSEERFRVLVESVDDYAIFMLDPAGHVSTWNAGAQRIKGYTRDEILGQHFSAFYPEEDRGKCPDELAIASSVGRFEEEGWRLRKDGTRFWANVVINALRSPSGALLGFAKITRDLTERRRTEELARELEREQIARAASEQAEAQIRESGERYRELNERLEIVLQGVADGITVEDRDGKLVYANAAAAKLSGFSTPEQMLATPTEEISARFDVLDEHGAVFDPSTLPARRVLRGEAAAPTLVHVHAKATGEDWWTLIRASAVMRAGKPWLAVNIWHDVTREQREHEALVLLARASALLASSLDHDEALQSLASAVVPTLAEACAIEVRAGEGLENVALAHTPAWQPCGDAARGADEVVRTGKSAIDEGSGRMIVPIVSRQGVVGAMVFQRPRPAYDHDDLALAEELGRRAAVAIEHARLLTTARDAARRAEEASRVKDEFLATVSHELRTPLNAILGWATLLREERGAETNGRIAKALEVIYRNANAQVRIIEDILDVSRIISGKLMLALAPSDVVRIARDAMDVVRPAAEARRIDLELVANRESVVLVADADRLQQVIWNLLSNAIKFTEPGGTVSLRIEQRGSDVRVIVTDTGRGIDAGFLPHVFERFRQGDSSTTREHAGLGLGLAIVRHIVELHGGRVSASSEGRGKGASFEAVLPIRAVLPKVDPSEAVESERPPAPTEDPPVRVEGLRVLVVDDDADARDVIHTLLTAAGACVETASSAFDAVGAVTTFRPHVLVSDIGMPHEDGYSLIRQLRAKGAAMPAIALTAYTRNDDRNRALAAGFTTHLAKPVSPHDLLLAVANLASLTKWTP